MWKIVVDVIKKYLKELLFVCMIWRIVFRKEWIFILLLGLVLVVLDVVWGGSGVGLCCVGFVSVGKVIIIWLGL